MTDEGKIERVRRLELTLGDWDLRELVGWPCEQWWGYLCEHGTVGGALDAIEVRKPSERRGGPWNHRALGSHHDDSTVNIWLKVHFRGFVLRTKGGRYSKRLITLALHDRIFGESA